MLKLNRNRYQYRNPRFNQIFKLKLKSCNFLPSVIKAKIIMTCKALIMLGTELKLNYQHLLDNFKTISLPPEKKPLSCIVLSDNRQGKYFLFTPNSQNKQNWIKTDFFQYKERSTQFFASLTRYIK